MREKKEAVRVIAHFRAYVKLAGSRGSPSSKVTYRQSGSEHSRRIHGLRGRTYLMSFAVSAESSWIFSPHFSASSSRSCMGARCCFEASPPPTLWKGFPSVGSSSLAVAWVDVLDIVVATRADCRKT